jgi:hypothetical protein
MDSGRGAILKSISSGSKMDRKSFKDKTTGCSCLLIDELEMLNRDILSQE